MIHKAVLLMFVVVFTTACQDDYYDRAIHKCLEHYYEEMSRFLEHMPLMHSAGQIANLEFQELQETAMQYIIWSY